MEDMLSQQEIDQLIEAFNNGSLEEWKRSHEIHLRDNMRFSVHNEINYRNVSRFKYNEVYTVEDYDLFYCHYALEKLTSNPVLLRRYAYGDIGSFKQYEYFFVLEDYNNRGINAVLVVGIPLDEIQWLKYNYHRYKEYGITYLVDASSLSYAFRIES